MAPVRLDFTATVRWGEQHRAVTRPDAAWLAELITIRAKGESLAPWPPPPGRRSPPPLRQH
ncbi:MAG: hypothetical protein ACRDQ4_06125 [Pseudonocardiaceae bacterium]